MKIYPVTYFILISLLLSCLKNNNVIPQPPASPVMTLLSKYNWYYDQNYDTSYFFIDTTSRGWPMLPILSSVDPNNDQDPCERNTFFSFQSNYAFVVKDCQSKTNFSGFWTLYPDSTLKIIPNGGTIWQPLVPNPNVDTVYWTLEQIDSSKLSLSSIGSEGWGGHDSAFITLLVFRHN